MSIYNLLPSAPPTNQYLERLGLLEPVSTPTAVAPTQPSVEEGVNQSYLDVFKRPASQEEIDFYVDEFGADNTYDAGEEAALESRLAAVVGEDIVGDTVEGGDAGGDAAPDSAVTSTRFSSSELGLDDTENKKTDTKISDLPAPRVVEDAPIATGLRQVFDQVVKRPPSAEDMDYYPELYGPTLDFEERARLTRALRPEQLAMFRRELDIPTLDFTTFGAAPVTTGEGATAGIERLRPTYTTGTMAGVFASPQFTTPYSIDTQQQKLPDTFTQLGDLFGAQYKAELAKEAAEEAAEAEGKRAGGLASLGYRRGGVVDENGIPRLFIGGLFKGIGKALRGVTKIAPFVLPFIPGFQGLALGKQALLGGLAGGFAGGDGKFDLKRALTSGLTTYGIGRLAQAADVPVGTEGGGVDAGGGISIEPGTGAAVKSGPTGIEGFQGGSTISTAKNVVGVDPMITGKVGQNISFDPRTGETFSFVPKTLTTQTGQSINTGVGRASYSPYDTTAGTSTAPSGFGIDRLKAEAVGTGQRMADTFRGLTSGDIAAKELVTPALTTVGGIAATQAGDEYAKQQAEYKALTAADAEDKERKRKRILETLRANPYGYNKGGVSALPPRYLDGAGDGMSDSIKANIGGMQEARLADGEFVVPADVVADLGNGSSNAGAERLYSMMDRVRTARHGTTKQPPEINVNKTLPA